MQLKQRWVTIFFVFFISSCSIKVVYNQLGWLIPNYVESKVTLDDFLYDKLESRVEDLLEWHRKNQLIAYAEWVKQAQQVLLKEPERQHITSLIEQFEVLFSQLLTRLDTEMAELLPLLNPLQQQQLFSSLKDDNEEYLQQMRDQSKEEQIEVYKDRLLENIEDWTGSLNSRQETWIEQTASQLQSNMAYRLKRREIWQQGIQDILLSEIQTEQKQKQLVEFQKQFRTQTDPLVEQKSGANQQLIVDLLIRIANSFTDEQREELFENSEEIIEDLMELAFEKS